MQLIATPDGFSLRIAGREVVRHSAASPCLFVGQGEERMDMVRGNFDISDYVTARIPLAHVELDGSKLRFRAVADGAILLTVETSAGDRVGALRFIDVAGGVNRLWIRLVAVADESVWGCGEQMSYLDLRGRRFPLWTSEPGVGRDKTTHLTWQADVMGRAGGDYYTTNYPQPTFLSSRRYAAHVETTAYSAFDFRHKAFHELEIWAVPQRVEFFAAPNFVELVGLLSGRFGRQPPLPEWATRGLIVGLKQGDESFALLDRYIDAGVTVSGLWCEDWAGIRTTSFGTRLFWDWTWNPKRYADLPERIGALRERGIRFLGYVNPYLCVDGALFVEAEALGHLALDAAGETYRVDFGEFDCGVVDFTKPEAAAWFAERIIRREMIGIGQSGWMADFGEYLPIDTHLASGLPAKLAHNAWPTIWAKVNADAVAAAGQTGETVFFMRAGYTGVQAHCPLLWAGDQSVDFSRHDGLQTVICGALSSGLLGNAYHHSDIGGYTSLFGNVRTRELMQRWAEMAAFTPVMRTHEGNRPSENMQFHTDAEAMASLARMVRVHDHLQPYIRALVADAATHGLPMQRPLFLHFPDEARLYGIHDQFLFGPDLLVAPVHAAGAETWRVLLPARARWKHVWTGTGYDGGGNAEVAAPIGQPPVFWREGSDFADLFVALSSI